MTDKKYFVEVGWNGEDETYAVVNARTFDVVEEFGIYDGAKACAERLNSVR